MDWPGVPSVSLCGPASAAWPGLLTFKYLPTSGFSHRFNRLHWPAWLSVIGDCQLLGSDYLLVITDSIYLLYSRLD